MHATAVRPVVRRRVPCCEACRAPKGALPPSELIQHLLQPATFEWRDVRVRVTTADAALPTFKTVEPECRFPQFEPITIDGRCCCFARNPLSSVPAIHFRLDSSGILLPFSTTDTLNRFLVDILVPSLLQSAFISPLLKKVCMDSADVSSYQPISNLSVITKLVERLAAKHLEGYLAASILLPKQHSGCHAHHSTVTAVLSVYC